MAGRHRRAAYTFGKHRRRDFPALRRSAVAVAAVLALSAAR